MTKRFRNLSPAQERVFEQIIREDIGDHDQRTINVLLKLDLIKPRTKYFVTVKTYREWKKWCAAAEKMQATQQPAASGGAGARGRDDSHRD